jgi:AcrR family transcriptional regulator
MSDSGSKANRPYRMRARADSVAATRERILAAAESASAELQYEEITFAVLAERAGVSVQTIIRHFGSRDDLFVALVQRLAMQMAGDRDVEPSQTPKQIAGILTDHYERFGDRILWGLGQEDRHPQFRMLAELGRIYHAEWCRQAFAPALGKVRGKQRERRLCQLIAVTDIYVWKVLRRDRELSVPQVKLAVQELIEPLLEPSS